MLPPEEERDVIAKYRYKSVGEAVEGRPTLSIRPAQTVLDAAVMMKEGRVGSLLVVEDEQLRGILTERDVMNRVVAARLAPDQTPVHDVMTESPMTIEADRPVVEALGIMLERGFRHLPVMHAGSVIGVVSIRDIPPQYWVMLDNWATAKRGVAIPE